MARIVVPDDAPPVLRGSRACADLLRRAEAEIYDTLPGSEAGLVERIREAEVVLNIRSSTRFTESVFRQCPALRQISVWGTGLDNIDLEAAARHGVRVTNTPGVSAESVAEHTLALMLAVARRIPAMDARVRQGEWPRGGYVQLSGKVLGVIGLGAIGRRMARLGAGIGMRVVAWSRQPKPGLEIPLLPLESLLSASDVVSLHLRLTPETHGFLGRREIGLIKTGAFLLNTARGGLVDEDALLEALNSGKLAGAGLDVFGHEPLPAGHPLMSCPNVVLSPHSAGITPEALEAGLQMAVHNIFA